LRQPRDLYRPSPMSDALRHELPDSTKEGIKSKVSS
jgi:hypothetical protein